MLLFRRTPGESKIYYRKVERQLHRIKDVNYPKAPKRGQQIKNAFENDQIMTEHGYNLSGNARLYIDTIISEKYTFCLFASINTINLIQTNIRPNRRNYLMDATFKIVPYGKFTQLLIIYIEWSGDVSFDCSKLRKFKKCFYYLFVNFIFYYNLVESTMILNFYCEIICSTCPFDYSSMNYFHTT